MSQWALTDFECHHRIWAVIATGRLLFGVGLKGEDVLSGNETDVLEQSEAPNTRSPIPPQLVKALADGRVMVVCGAGVSQAATGGKAPSWMMAVERAIAEAYPKGEAEPYLNLIQSAAKIGMAPVLSLLNAPVAALKSDDSYNNWLYNLFGKLNITNKYLTDHINKISILGNKIATTNYDNILRQATNLDPLTNYGSPDAVAEFLKGDAAYIWHLHGHISDLNSIVFSRDDYNRLASKDAIQRLQTSAAVNNTLLFIGCSVSGLSDDNVGELMNWIGKHFTKSEHYALCTIEDINKEWPKSVTPLSFGNTHVDLPEYLGQILTNCGVVPEPSQSLALPTQEAFEGFYDPLEEQRVKPAPSLRDYLYSDTLPYYGWAEHAKETRCPADERDTFSSESKLLVRLKASNKPLVLTGEGGVGKTRLRLELSKLAKQRGWRVFAMEHNATPLQMEAVAVCARTTPQTDYLISIDNIEDLARPFDFDRFHETAQACDNLHLVATCRKSFLNGDPNLLPARLRSDASLRIDLSLDDKSEYALWLKSWIHKSCKEIWNISVEASRDPVSIPALAVILRFADDQGLQGSNPGQDQQQGVLQLIQRSIQNYTHSNLLPLERLAAVLCCFPLDSNIWDRFLQDETNKSIFFALHTDGWIYQASGPDGQWKLGHDLLCDLPLLKALEELTDPRLRIMLNFWQKADAVPSAFNALQRIQKPLADQLGALGSALLVRDFGPHVAALAKTPDVAKAAVVGCFRSLSLDPFEKLRVLFALPTLSEFQISELKRTFAEEQDKFCEFAQEVPTDIVTLLFVRYGDIDIMQAMLREWIDPTGKNAHLQRELKAFSADPDLLACNLAFDKATTLKGQAEIAAYQNLDERFGRSQHRRVQIQCAEALYNLGITYRQVGKPEESPEPYLRIFDRYHEINDQRLAELCSMALLNRGFTYVEYLQNPDKALESFDLLIQTYQDFTGHEEVQLQCAKAQNAKCVLLFNVGKLSEAAKACTQLIKTWQGSTKPQIEEFVARAQLIDGLIPAIAEEPKKAANKLEAFVDKYEKSTSAPIGKMRLRAQQELVELYIRLDKPDRALVLAKDVLKQIDATENGFVVMPFLLWLGGAKGCTAKKVATAITKLSDGTNKGWSFAEIQRLIDALPDKKKPLADAFIQWFEGEISREDCLKVWEVK